MSIDQKQMAQMMANLKTVTEMYYIETACPKDKIQTEVMIVIQRLIGYANKKNITQLEGIIKKYHNRNGKFKELMKKYYDSFENTDTSI